MMSDKNGLHRSFENDVMIPAAQAIISGALLGVAVFTLAILAKWQEPWIYGAGAWAVGTFAAWFIFVKKGYRLLEVFYGVDLDGDGQIGEPMVVIEPPHTTRIEIVGDEGRWGDMIDLPVTPQIAAEASRMLTSGADFSLASLAGPNKVMSRAEFEAFRDELIRRGYARWVNPRAHSQGAQLTSKGWATIRGYASMAAGDMPRLLK